MEIITDTSKIEQPLRGVIFDMDGVTVDSMGHSYNWQKHIYEMLGDKSREFGAYTDDWMDNYNKIYADGGIGALYDNLSHIDWNLNESRIWEEYNKYNLENPLSTIKVGDVDMKDVIKEVYRRGSATPNRMTRLRLGVNTTKGRSSLDRILDEAEISGCFDTVVTYDDILRVLVNGKVKQENVKTEDIEYLRKFVPGNMKEYIEKPNSLSSMLTINALGVEPREIVAFEDTVNGIHAYKNIMMPPRPQDAYVVGVTWGFVKNKDTLINAGADAILEHPGEIIPFLETLGAFK